MEQEGFEQLTIGAGLRDSYPYGSRERAAFDSSPLMVWELVKED